MVPLKNKRPSVHDKDWASDPQSRLMRNITAGAMAVIAIISFPAAAMTFSQYGMATPTEIREQTETEITANSEPAQVETEPEQETNAEPAVEAKPAIVSERVLYDGERYAVSGTAVNPDGTPLSHGEVIYEFYDENGLSYGQIFVETDDDGSFSVVASGDTVTASIGTVASFTCLNANGITQSQAAAAMKAARASFIGDDAATQKESEPKTVENAGQYYIWSSEAIDRPFSSPSDGKLGKYQENWYIARDGDEYYQPALESLKAGDRIAIDGKTVVIEQVKRYDGNSPYDGLMLLVGPDKICFARHLENGDYSIAYGTAEAS